ncbi:MAG: hypothetical protein MUC96_11725 [Myxococcaceae bacterium]|nr:hypothetical protein [Myxococcaceae bacterium]
MAKYNVRHLDYSADQLAYKGCITSHFSNPMLAELGDWNTFWNTLQQAAGTVLGLQTPVRSKWISQLTFGVVGKK